MPTETATGIQLVVGLGNPGKEYEKTRHNVGAWFVDRLAQRHSATLKAEKKFFGAVAKINIAGKAVWLLIPTTYMNESGKAIAAIAKFYKIPPEAILVAHDELDFPVGQMRIKEGGGHGGHNGLRDIMRHLKTGDFFRLRIGIGHPGHKDKVTPYVLSQPSKSDKERIQLAIDDGLRAIPDIVSGKFEKAMRHLHQ